MAGVLIRNRGVTVRNRGIFVTTKGSECCCGVEVPGTCPPSSPMVGLDQYLCRVDGQISYTINGVSQCPGDTWNPSPSFYYHRDAPGGIPAGNVWHYSPFIHEQPSGPCLGGGDQCLCINDFVVDPVIFAIGDVTFIKCVPLGSSPGQGLPPSIIDRWVAQVTVGHITTFNATALYAVPISGAGPPTGIWPRITPAIQAYLPIPSQLVLVTWPATVTMLAP